MSPEKEGKGAMKAKIYIAGPMFSEAEMIYNERISHLLEGNGYGTFLPQRDAADVGDLRDAGMTWEQANSHIFEQDIQGIRDSDIVLFVLDGRVPDDGACVEIGYAYAMGKECIGLKTDPRSFMGEQDNPMIIGALRNRIAKNPDDLLEFLSDLSKRL